MGLCLLGGNNCRHNKGVISAMFLANWNLENSIVLKTLRHLMSSGYVYLYPYT